MRTIRTKVYQFDELDDKAKERAIEDYRGDGPDTSHIYDEAHESVKEFHKLFGTKDGRRSWLDIYFDHMDDNILELSGVRLRTYIINNYYSTFFEPKSYGEYKKRDNGKWRYDRYSKCQFKETCCPFTGVCYDESLLDPLRKFIKKPTGDSFKDLLEECISTLKQDLENEEEAMNEDDYISEEIRANDYEFTKEGKRFNH